MIANSSVRIGSSSIAGLGVFAARDFAAGEVIRRVVPEREITAAAPRLEHERIEHCAFRDDRMVLIGAPDRHVNHSCNPNAYYDFPAGRWWLDGYLTRARRDIYAGVEITVDYLINTAEGDSWPCHCGAARCRGATGRGYFELPLAVQIEYAPLLARWFRLRHAERIAQLDRAAGGASR